jgi:hypothetical protein
MPPERTYIHSINTVQQHPHVSRDHAFYVLKYEYIVLNDSDSVYVKRTNNFFIRHT